MDETKQGRQRLGGAKGARAPASPPPPPDGKGPPVLARSPFTRLHPADSPSRGEHTNQKTFPLFLTRGPGVVIYGF